MATDLVQLLAYVLLGQVGVGYMASLNLERIRHEFAMLLVGVDRIVGHASKQLSVNVCIGGGSSEPNVVVRVV